MAAKPSAFSFLYMLYTKEASIFLLYKGSDYAGD